MIYLAIVSLIWAFSFGIIGSSLAGVDSFLVATIRLACASLLFFPFLRLKQISGKDCIRLFCYGSVQFGLMYVLYLKAFQYLPSHLVALFSILTPVYVVLIHDLRSRVFSPRYLIAACLSVLGAAIIKIQGVPSGSIWLGFILMQLAGLSFAFGQIAYRDWKQSHPSVLDRSVFPILSLGGVLSAGLLSLVFADPEKLSVTTSQWQSILYLGFIASGLGFFLWNKGASQTNPGTLAVFNNAVVPLAMFVSLFIFGEIASITTDNLLRLIIGGLLIVIAVSISTKKKY
tara:strand:+ start:1242 stop:2102 length:861 start_codon:yes stop_codon:yes gene_type:complete